MPHAIPWQVQVHQHPGSSAEEIESEPDWSGGHEHRVGFVNRQNRRPGLTHEQDEDNDDENELQFSEKAKEEYHQLVEKERKGELVNFRDLVEGQEDLHLRVPQNRPYGWRYVLDATEDWTKNQQEWPANIERRKKQEDAGSKDHSRKGDGVKTVNGGADKDSDDQSQEEHDWRRKQGQEEKHNDAYGVDGGDKENGQKSSQQNSSEYDKLLERYTPQEISLLRSLQHEKEYRIHLKQNDGKRESPQKHNRTSIAILEDDQFTPDNWLPRTDHLVRLTGKHPMNAEADLTALFDAGLVTPNELHYIRNHGAVPRILWEYHRLDVNNGALVLSMDDLKDKYECINIPVSLACDGNRRKELNMIRKSKGFSWGAGALGTVYWKGPLLRDILLAAGVKEGRYTGEGKLRWVNFQGADEPSEGRYETCIPLDYAMDPTNDVLLAYEMNGINLPPDHGYPIRLVIPGWVGGRCVKWLQKIWITDHENTSHYHIWDNRVLPSFITEKDGEFAEAMFHHPDTACNEQNLNSAIVHPAQGEKLPLTEARSGKTYRIEGYAYDGGGHEVQRVEVSLDGGTTWLYCIRKFPEYPIRHGKKFWTWLHWHVEISMVHLLNAKSISVRAWNVFKNTQPQEPSWNTMGMMNNCWYVVKGEVEQGGKDGVPVIVFRHPCEPGTGDGGWMKPSVENRIASATQAAGTPQKEFTREEVEKHDKEGDCWLVVDGNVYDCTSVLSWHPGGKAAILGHAGKVHQETSNDFASIHDDFAYQKLKQCALGVVTAKAANFIKATAEAAAKEKAEAAKNRDSEVLLQKHKWTPVKLKDRQDLSEDTRKYVFALPKGQPDLGLGTCQHIQLGFHLRDKMLIRSYTPTRPLLPDPKKAEGRQSNGLSEKARDMQDGQSQFELVVKTYFPSTDQPGGAMSNILDCIQIGEEVQLKGPTGEIEYRGKGAFLIEGKKRAWKNINLVLGGSGLTPGYALIARVVYGGDEDTSIRVVDANKSEKDILLRDELATMVKDSNGRLKIAHVLSHPSEDWKGLKGHVNADVLKQNLFPPSEESATFCCGPPAMITKAALPVLKDWGYVEDQNLFGF